MEEGRKVDDVVEKIARRYARRVFWSDEADLRQEAHVAVLRAQATWDPETGVPFSAYAWRACALALRTYLWRQSAPVNETDHRLHTLRGVHRAQLGEVALEVPDSHELLEEKRWHEAARAQVHALLAPLGTDAAKIAARVLLDEEKPDLVAREMRLQPQTVYRIVRKARMVLGENWHLYQLWRTR